MPGGIYTIRNDGKLIEMKEEAYHSEGDLQSLLAGYPNLLAGDQIDSQAPHRWLLVSTETPVPSDEESSGRWALDHLFLDQDGIPTLVEVKRSADTRIRREVVGQMLDYAADAIAYMPVGFIRTLFERTCETRGSDDEAVLAEFLGDQAQQVAFWQKVNFPFQIYKTKGPFDSEEKRHELLCKLNSFLVEKLPDNAVPGYPGIWLSALKGERSFHDSLKTFEWFSEQVLSS